MAIPTYPGVYVEEVSSGVRPISAASTSIAGFIGEAERGPIDEPVRIFNFTQFQNLYGGFLSYSYLAHAVYQFFNNGGAQCYILRVAGEGVETASIGLKDRAATNSQLSLTINAASPGVWGNRVEVVIKDGSQDPGNEFNLQVFVEGEETPRESYENLSMVPERSNFVEKATNRSNLVRVIVNRDNVNVVAGFSQSGTLAKTLSLEDSNKMTKLRINIDGDGYQEIDLRTGVNNEGEMEEDKAHDLESLDNIAKALHYAVHQLKPMRQSNKEAYDYFDCEVIQENETDNGKLLLTSGSTGVASSVTVLPANDKNMDATGLLKLGRNQTGAVETLGGAVTRPVPNSDSVPRYLVGDHMTPATGVVDRSVVPGDDGDPITDDQPYTDSFEKFDRIDDLSLLATPGRGSDYLIGEGMNYCANRPLSDCFFIGDTAQDDDTVEELKVFVDGISTKNSYGAVYAPWLLSADPSGVSSEPIAVPPSGYVAGLYAATDARRGVWKAPAGTAAALAGTTGIVVNFSDVEHGVLNPLNVNLIRQFPSAGRIIWGARTVSSDSEWRYIPVRRMAIFLRVSIYNGIQFAVFEPNDEPLWSQLRLNIRSFMMNLFRRGAFQGSTPSQAFFVKCDNETTTQDDIDQGIVNVHVGFAPLKPAEFVVVRISQQAGQSG